MSQPPSPIPSGPSGLPSWDVLLYSAMGAGGVVIAALIACFGVLFSQRAPLQAALNGAFSALTKELQDERARLIARISEHEVLQAKLEADMAEARLEVIAKDNEIRGLKQLRDSLERSVQRLQSELDDA